MRYFFLILFPFLTVLLDAKTIEVGKSKTVNSITEALSLAEDYDTILINHGIYKEQNINVEKKVILIGINYPILDGEKKYEILSINSDSVIVKGLKLINTGHMSTKELSAIRTYNSGYITIEDNILEDNFFGIYIHNGHNTTIKNNKVINHNPKHEVLSGNAIHCWKSNNLLVIGNEVIGHRDGIYFEFVYDSLAWRNISKGNLRYGLHFMFSHNDSYISNVFINNGAGVAVMYTQNVKMYNNFFKENWGDAAYGLLLKEISRSIVEGNTFVHNTSGIFMEGTTDIKIHKNKFLNNGWGLRVQASCIENEIYHNNFMGNTFDMATNGTLVMNTFDENYWDKYEGYDLDRDGYGDVPFHPLSLFSVLVEKNPSAMLLFRSFIISLLDKSEKILPSITPDNFVDNKPLIRPLPL